MVRADLAHSHGTLVQARLLGRVRIACGELRIERQLSARSLLVCAILLHHQREALNRDELAFTLWPDLGESEARAALRRELYKIHRAFPPTNGSWILCDARTVGWAAGADTWVDVVEFERLCGDLATVERAIELYEGPFAPQLDHEWASALRDRLARSYSHALELAIKGRGIVGDLAGTLLYVERLLAHDPWREDALCGLILLRCRLGDRAGALSYYRQFCVRLRDEFGVEPMPETAACYERIARGIVTQEPIDVAAALAASA
jgi:DNA-binding SARP family transcriptional activator